MFPSCGFFSSYPCRFFASGLCERPYCHFRHSKHDLEKESAPSYVSSSADNAALSSDSSSGQPAVSVNGDLISLSSQQHSEPSGSDEQYFTSGSSSSEKSNTPPSSVNHEQSGSFSIPSFTDNSSKYQVPVAEEPEQYVSASPENRPEQGGPEYAPKDDGPSSLPTYLPTPKTPSLPVPEPVKDEVGVPVYQPTPKRELKRRHEDHVKSSKVKNSDLEYDPECNFSCGGLISSSVDKAKLDVDAVNYKPTSKKRRVDNDCLPDDEEDEDMPCGEFSDEEEYSEEVAHKMEEGTEKEGVKEGDECFESICDDDISSDDDAMIEVPDEVLSESGAKQRSVGKDKRPSAAKSVGEKNASSKAKAVLASKTKSDKTKKDHDQISRSHSSSKKLLSKSPPKCEKSVKSSSSDKKTSSSKVDRHNSRNSPSSSKSHSSKEVSEKSKNSSKQKVDHNSKNSDSLHRDRSSATYKNGEKITSDKHGSNKTSSSKKSSSGKQRTDEASKHATSERRGSSETRQSASSGKANGDSKSRSSLDNKRDERHLNSESRSAKDAKSKTHSEKHSGDRASNGKNIGSSSKTSSSKSAKPSSGEKGSSPVKNRTSTSGKSTSSGIKVRERQNSNSSSSSRKDASKCSSKHSEKTVVDGKQRKRTSSQEESHKLCSSPKKSENKKKSSADSATCLKEGKPNHRRSSHREESILERMNSSLFGDDSDNDVADSVLETGDDEVNEFTDTTTVEQEESVDYSSYIHDSDFEEEDTFDECWRIFKEGPQPKKTIAQQEKKLAKDQKKDLHDSQNVQHDVSGKKRTAHKAAEQIRKPQLQKKARPHHMVNPAEVMHHRIMEMQRKALERAAKQAVQEQEVSSTSGSTSNNRSQISGRGGEKKRVAHVPKPAAPSVTTKTKAPSGQEKKTTLAITASKTEKRVAHTPNLPNLKRPVIPASFGSKVPSNIRQRYLNLIIDECLKICESEEKAYKKALEEEAVVYERSNTKNIYLRVAVNAITRLRTEAKESLPGTSSSKEQHAAHTQSHQATLGGSRAAKTSFTLHRSTGSGKKVEVVLTETELYQRLLKYTMTEEQLKENGYPRTNPDTPGKVAIQGRSYQDTDTLLKENERTCSRCGKRFIVNADGSYVRSEECVYHWTRAYPRKKSGFIQHIYNCCSSDTSSQGCQIASNHVHDQNKRNNLSGFMSTMPRSPPRDGNYGIYALDCEMVYTQGGLELARVTVVNTEGESVFESLVQPFHPIVDYNTRFSGLTASDLKHVEVTLTDVQAVLLNLFSSKSILIGHSLESDLIALKLIHSTVVDTSVVFPHRLGPPYKRALKNLMLETFQKIIQCDDGGHDSKEDAVACLQLMKWRIKEDSKRDNRYSRD